MSTCYVLGTQPLSLGEYWADSKPSSTVIDFLTTDFIVPFFKLIFLKPFNKVATLKKIIMVGLLWGIIGIFARASIGDFRGGFTSESIGEELIKYGGFTWPMSHVIGTIIPILWPPAGVRGRIMLHDFFTVPMGHISRLPYSVGIDLAIWTIGLISWIVMGSRGPGEAMGKMFIAYPCFGVFVFVIFVLLGGIISAGLFYLIIRGVGYLLKKLSKATE
ncbi:hypothetical protein [Thermoanaerobacter sp. RKWS2]|uniref:hypothetical protein n=1 Tax=Thermoanaerobacter sp. RKWS2 TaxID=2983842 RepID=UPI00224A6CF9|nr:hypothetical protein [Thermoanaerobacter sp. RKWS2]UZQ83958.1 hypothetical protein OEI98_001116 [Thermoanaerobacter sp. RKWS2]